MNLFTAGLLEQKTYKITKPVRLIELFAGIGSQAKAFERLGVPFEHFKICEFDKYAVKAYNIIHGTDFEVSDITKLKAEDLEIVNKDKYEYIMTYSFPCQDLSLAGKRKGMAEDSGTRSSLLWEVKRLLEELDAVSGLPQILCMENVPQVKAEQNIIEWYKWRGFLEKIGYTNFYGILNAKNYGIPQNRERCFMMSLLNADSVYVFPEKEELKLRLKDMLEEEVDEKYYLSEKLFEFFQANCIKQQEKGNIYKFEINDGNKIAKTITTLAGCRMGDNFIETDKCIQVGQLADSDFESSGRVYSPAGLSPTILTCGGGTHEIKITEVGNYPPGNYDSSRVVHPEGLAPAVRENHGTVAAINKKTQVRKLTPRECFRLMGFDDADVDKCKSAGISDSQLYKMAGNSIVVNVLEKIFKQFYEGDVCLKR